MRDALRGTLRATLQATLRGALRDALRDTTRDSLRDALRDIARATSQGGSSSRARLWKVPGFFRQPVVPAAPQISRRYAKPRLAPTQPTQA